jgi:hypothetical protein
MWKWIAVIVVIVLAGWFIWQSGWLGGTSSQTGAAANSTSTGSASTGMSNSSDTSNAGLVQDTTAIDAQMKGLDQDSASANQADQPVQQAY